MPVVGVVDVVVLTNNGPFNRHRNTRENVRQLIDTYACL